MILRYIIGIKQAPDRLLISQCHQRIQPYGAYAVRPCCKHDILTCAGSILTTISITRIVGHEDQCSGILKSVEVHLVFCSSHASSLFDLADLLLIRDHGEPPCLHVVSRGRIAAALY